MFLLFAPKEKRISYAASFGVPEIPENRKKHFSQWLMEMKAISVREQRGAEIVKELTGRTVPVVIDPTMLLSTEEWDEIACAPYWWLNQKECKGYVLLYFLGKMPTQIRNNVQKISKEKNLMIVNLMDENNMWYLTSPAEFLYLVAHAELVYTDSFHATVFSILYHTPFITCKKYEKTPKDNMHSRLVTLLERFQYADRLVTEEDNYILSNPFEMNFANVDHILEKERHKSACFLTKALSTNKT